MFKPCNRYILIERTQQDAEDWESYIELPEDYCAPSLTHELVKIKAIACAVKPPLPTGQRVVVLRHMIEEVDFGEGKVYLVLENNVLGIIGENTK